MKKNIYISIITIVFTVTLILFSNNVKAAGSFSISVSKSTVNVGENVTLNITGSNAYGKLNISATNASLSASTVFLQNDTKTVTVTPNGVGTVNITVTPSASGLGDSDENPITGPKYATINVKENTVVNNNDSGTTTGQSSSATNTSQNKSSNANLSNLGIRPNDFSGFKPGTTTYNVTVPNDVKSVELYGKAQDSKATITGNGTKNLQEGVNALSIIVTAEDGTKKTYTVNVTRQSGDETREDEKEEQQEDQNLEEEQSEELTKEGLIELNIEDVQIDPNFETGIYEYTAKYIGEATQLNIQAKANNEDYVVEIIGNKDLQEGENLVTILVTDTEGKNVATYQITVNKSLVDEEAIARENEEKKKKVIIGGAIAALVIIVLIIIIIVRSKRKKSFVENYSVPYSGINNNDENEELLNDNQDYNFEKENDGSFSDEKDDEYVQEYNEDDVKVSKRGKHKGKRFK